MLRIESTFRHIRDIHNYNCRQAGAVIGQLDRTLPCLDNKNLWFAIRKMEQIYHLGGYEHFRYKLNEHPKAVDKVRLLNRMLKNKKIRCRLQTMPKKSKGKSVRKAFEPLTKN